MVTGVVYLIRMGEFHKIGKSNDPGRRVYELGLRLPEKHDVVHVIETDDPSGIEAYWHRRFAAQRVNGEWFRLSPSDVTAFRRRSYM
ncbi:MAG: GIY-YIG nuclease family protein [Actinomycetes bacterium]